MKRIADSVKSPVKASGAWPSPRQPVPFNAYTNTVLELDEANEAKTTPDAWASANPLAEPNPLPLPAEVLQRAAEQQRYEAAVIEAARRNNDTRLDWGKLDTVDGAVLTERMAPPAYASIASTLWGGTGLGVAMAPAMTPGARRPKDEDRVAVRHFSQSACGIAGGLSIAGIFDGHCGADVAEWARRYVPPILGQHLAQLTPEQQRNPERVALALQDAFAAPEDGTSRTSRSSVFEELGFRSAGSTALVAVRLHGMLYLSNLGDSRALIVDHAGNTHRLSVDQKPGDPDERARIVARGGLVRRCSGVLRVDGVLAMARSLGDSALHRGTRPDVSYIPERGVAALIMGSDGLFDVVHDAPIGAFVNRVRLSQRYVERKPADIASLAAGGLLKWASARGSYDDVTVMVALLPGFAGK